jgi:hypothetical protein
MEKVRVKQAKQAKQAIAAVTLMLAPLAVLADPGYYLVTVYENEGEKSIDFRYWTVKLPSRPEVIWPEIGFGYGVTKRWYTEVFASYIGSSELPLKLSTWNWQNDYLLTQGQYPFDLALHTNLFFNQGAGSGYALEFGPALQTEIGRTQFNANLVFERAFGVAPAPPTQLKYQWQVKHRFRPTLELGLQGFGELGEWNHWSPKAFQSHRVGPVIGGTLDLGGKQAIKYQLAVLYGSIYTRNGYMVSTRVQYVF